MIEHRAEIAHVKAVAAQFKFEKMLCLIGPLPADMLADDGAARNSSHACDFSHTLLRLTQSGFRFSSRDVSTRPSTGRPDPLHPRSVAAVEHFPCQALEGRVSDISQREGYSWHLNSNAAEQRLSTIRVIRSSEELRAAVAGQRLWAGSHEGQKPKCQRVAIISADLSRRITGNPDLR